MRIISKQPNPSGAYPPIQTWNGAIPPEGFYEITCDTTEFFNGFIIPTVDNSVVTSFVCNTTEWEAWKAAEAAKPPIVPSPTTEEKQAEQIRAQNATIAMMSSVINDLIADVEALKA